MTILYALIIAGIILFLVAVFGVRWFINKMESFDWWKGRPREDDDDDAL